jgi:GH25 family lysozyme M1 (1,4-beta-N-acetylmuramidase)
MVVLLLKMKTKIIFIFVIAIISLIIPCFIVWQGGKPENADASYTSALKSSSESYESKAAPTSKSSQVSSDSHTPSSKTSQISSELPPLLSLEPKLSGMSSNGMITLRIIDFSNGIIINNWDLVKKNVDGIYVKATEGSTYTDPSFASFAKGAISAHIPIGFYHYLWASSNSQNVKQQADYFYNAIKKYKYDYHPVLDIEKTNGQNAKTIIENVKVFSEEFNRVSKQQIMIYCSPNFANSYLSDKSLTHYPLWIANYNVNDPIQTIIWSTFDMWQYGVNITIPGVKGKVDGDIATNNIFLDINSAPKF